MQLHSLKLTPVAFCVFMTYGGAVVGEELATSQKKELETSVQLPVVDVISTSLGKAIYSEKDIEEAPIGNNDLTSLISDLPSIRVDQSTSGGGNRGSLAPESFSVYGESPFQNQFQIDGIESTNIISAHSRDEGQTATVGTVTSYSQAYNIDTDLLGEVIVHDSNVPVEYGSFQGAVVDAKIKRPRGSNTWKLKQNFNTSNLTKQRIATGAEDKWLDGQPGYSSVWRKTFRSIQGDVALPYETAALISFSRRESLITRNSAQLAPAQNGISTSSDSKEITEKSKDIVDNTFLKLSKNVGSGLNLDILLKYANRKEEGLSRPSTSSSYFRSANWGNEQDSHGIALDVKQKTPYGLFSINTSIDTLNSIRQSDSDSLSVHLFTGGTTTQNNANRYTTGGWGNEQLKQNQFINKLRFDFDTLNSGALSHDIYFGVDYKIIGAHFYRPRNIYTNTYSHNLSTNVTNHVQQNVYLAGDITIDYRNFGIYLSDSLIWRNFNLNIGFRFDKDNFLKNNNFAPRANFSWNIGGTKNHKASMGWSRYFGADMLGFAMQHEKNRLIYRTITNNITDYRQISVQDHTFSQLKTPHSDEFAVGYQFDITNKIQVGLSYIERNSRNGISKVSKGSSKYEYINSSRLDSENINVSFMSLQSFKLAAAKWTAAVDFSWQKARRNHDALEGWDSGEYDPNEKILVNDVITDYQNKPASDFNLPKKVSLKWNASWESSGVTWVNRLNWNSKRTGIAYIGTKTISAVKYDNYVSQTLPSNWTWDTSVLWKPKFAKGAYFHIEVLNLLNKNTEIAITNPSAANNIRYQNGREIWLNAGYEF